MAIHEGIDWVCTSAIHQFDVDSAVPIIALATACNNPLQASATTLKSHRAATPTSTEICKSNLGTLNTAANMLHELINKRSLGQQWQRISSTTLTTALPKEAAPLGSSQSVASASGRRWRTAKCDWYSFAAGKIETAARYCVVLLTNLDSLPATYIQSVMLSNKLPGIVALHNESTCTIHRYDPRNQAPLDPRRRPWSRSSLSFPVVAARMYSRARPIRLEGGMEFFL